ncbi:hypothetical protein OROGR_027414 [Orobanche gracilis]
MGFNKVYRSLKEIFPQIDARVLRAVAIEHKKDADAAVEAVLVEIIPFFIERSRPSTPLTGSISEGESSEGQIAVLGSAAINQAMGSPSVNAVGSADGQNGHNMNGGNLESVDGHKEPFSGDGHLEVESNTVGWVLSGENLENSLEKKIDAPPHGGNVELSQLANKDGVNTLQVEVSGDLETDKAILDLKSRESTIKNSSDDTILCQAVSTLKDENIAANDNMSIIHEKIDRNHLETTSETATDRESDRVKSRADGRGTSSLTAHDLDTSPVKCNVNLEELDKSLSNNTASYMETPSHIVGSDNESTLNASISQSSQNHFMAVLEKIIAGARDNKMVQKTLLSGMKSVLSLMREVELKEQTAEQAKVEASMGGADILAKLEESKQSLQHAKESASMHAGEVYGEKAILATELRELQSRVLSLSEERNKSLTVLDEMRRSLEVRLSAAENKLKFAEQEKLEKEKAAMKALADHELDMEKVVQESKILRHQAEENSKLQEFLVDRGRIVDMLQGEIAVICDDVKLLKERFDENVPFSKSLSSGQTSCILASSTSFLRNPNPKDLVPDGADPLMAQSERDAISCFAGWSFEGESTRDDHNALADDGWILFDDRDVFA